MQKVFILLFVIFEAIVYVMMGGLAPAAELTGGTYAFMELILILQLIVGGYMIVLIASTLTMYMASRTATPAPSTRCAVSSAGYASMNT